ncbi:MAG: DUF1893 domain-containing protein [Tissierellia bacterium]|nr:DUF1893 domain-containing protein [Tissierellia bacterium]
MKDIEIAKEYLKEEDVAIAVVKDGKLIFKSNEKGIKPMYTIAMEMMNTLDKASIADKVIGKGAAILCKYMGIKDVHGQLMSASAIDFLEKTGIGYTYEKSCPYIENMDRTDLCPIERLAMDIEDGNILLDRIGKFIQGLS